MQKNLKKFKKKKKKTRTTPDTIRYEPIATSSRGQMTVDVVEMEMPK